VPIPSRLIAAPRDPSYKQLVLLILQKLREKARNGSRIPKALLQYNHGDGGSYIRRTPNKVRIDQVESFDGTLALIDSIERAGWHAGGKAR
jgi:hypothetical protein